MTTAPTKFIELRLAQSAFDFFKTNAIDAATYLATEEEGAPYPDWGVIDFAAFNGKPWEPEGYGLTYRNGDCVLALPPGRLIIIGQTAGHIFDASSTLPLEPLAYDDIMSLARGIGRSFDAAGWRNIRFDDTIRQETFGENSLGGKFEYLGIWVPCNDERLRAYIQIKSYNSLPPGPSIPPVPGTPLPDDYPDRYIIEILFSGDGLALGDELYRLRDARRLAVNGDKNKELTLKLWYDSPDWRPEGWSGRFVE